jgi:type IV secretory pathway VirJ component
VKRALLKGNKIACIFGEKEKESLCRSLDSSLAELISFPGGHHFGRNYRAVAQKVLSFERLEHAGQLNER